MDSKERIDAVDLRHWTMRQTRAEIARSELAAVEALLTERYQMKPGDTFDPGTGLIRRAPAQPPDDVPPQQ